MEDKAEIPFKHSAAPHEGYSAIPEAPEMFWSLGFAFPPVLPHSVPAFTIFPGSQAHFWLAYFLLVLAHCQKHSGSGKKLGFSAILRWF